MLNTTNIEIAKSAIGADLLQTLQDQFLVSAIHSFTGADELTVKRSWKRTEETMSEVSKRFISNASKNGRIFEPEVIKSAIQKIIDEQRKVALTKVAELVGADKY